MGVRKRSPLAEREQYVRDYTFPAPVLDRVRAGNPTLTADGLARVETALREWLVACTYRDGRALANPSTLADAAWSDFAACTPDYAEFCRHAFGRIESPSDPQPDTPPEVAAANTVAAWDRSQWSEEREAVMFGCDRELGIPTALSVEVDAARHLTREAFAAYITGRMRRRRFRRGRRGSANDPSMWLFPALDHRSRKGRFDFGQIPRDGFYGPGGAG
jgi:hypothetical protein